MKLRAGFVVLLFGLERVHERSQCEFAPSGVRCKFATRARLNDEPVVQV